MCGQRGTEAYMIQHKQVRGQAGGQIVVDAGLLSAQKVSHGVCEDVVSWPVFCCLY